MSSEYEDGGRVASYTSHADPSSSSSYHNTQLPPDSRTSHDSSSQRSPPRISTSPSMLDPDRDDDGRSSIASTTRMSNESLATPGGANSSRQRRRESLQDNVSVLDTASTAVGMEGMDTYVEDVVQPGFDEAILRALCDMDVSPYRTPALS